MARFGLDTNVLIRLAVRDDDRQYLAARRLFERRKPEDSFYVNLIVVLEAVWTLRRIYRYSKENALDFVQTLLEQKDVELDDHQLIGNALFEARKTGADFADLLVAEYNRQADCSLTYTFDRKAVLSVPGMELLQ